MIYVDTSALAKLVMAEPETESLRNYLRQATHEPTASSELTLVELRRAAVRRGQDTAELAEQVLARVDTCPLYREVVDRASSLDPSVLRTLDALHVATALELRASAVVTYDRRMLEACVSHGLTAVAPGAD
ncbi:type II toxin-antitoxin system VapC family toxin [Arthrobacter castelli]|uniref:type II toxin-antitoxin system VapC family toxin n=1 Tax=Arthrobacter castelli TaxID=271431 RepID=UPI00041F4F77|nr:type II toxin-antitoxin system VapC family toxin [Arthrobacter castelli]